MEEEPLEPTPTEPVEPTPTEPVEPTPTEPVEPTPTEPVEPTPTEPVEPTPIEPLETGYLVDYVHTFLGDAPFGLEWFPFVIGGVILMFLMEFVFDFFRDIGKAFWR